MNKHEQIYELSRNVLPLLPTFKRIDGKNCKLQISPCKAVYANGNTIMAFSGRTTLEACEKALAWLRGTQQFQVTNSIKYIKQL